jgi:hypothetical protein
VLFLRDGSMPDDVAALEAARSNPDASAAVKEYLPTVQWRAVAEHRERTLPLAVGRTILSLLLVIASAMVLSGRSGARGFALQVLGANALFNICEYALTRPVRAQWIGAWANSQLGVADPQLGAWLTPAAWFWMSRLVAAVEVGIPTLALFAVLSKRSRTFLVAAADADARREREDEP